MPKIRKTKTNALWTEEVLALLRKITDTSIARKLGISSMTVLRMREKLSIPTPKISMVSSDRSVEFSWTDESLAMLGKEPDTTVGTRLGLNRRAVWEKSASLSISPCPKHFGSYAMLSDDIIQKLGKIPDSELARTYGIPDYMLYQARKDRSIPAYVRKSLLTDELKSELGTASDYTLAAKYNVSPTRVRTYRNALNISSFKPGQPSRNKGPSE